MKAPERIFCTCLILKFNFDQPARHFIEIEHCNRQFGLEKFVHEERKNGKCAHNYGDGT